jgi:hypothetical protein
MTVGMAPGRTSGPETGLVQSPLIDVVTPKKVMLRPGAPENLNLFMMWMKSCVIIRAFEEEKRGDLFDATNAWTATSVEH